MSVGGTRVYFFSAWGYANRKRLGTADLVHSSFDLGVTNAPLHLHWLRYGTMSMVVLFKKATGYRDRKDLGSVL